MPFVNKVLTYLLYNAKIYFEVVFKSEVKLPFKPQKEIDMKKFLAIFLALLICVPLLASCNLDLSEQFNQLSDQLFSQIVDLAGGFIKEDTTPKETFDYSSELIKDSSTEDIESTPVETEPEILTSLKTPTSLSFPMCQSFRSLWLTPVQRARCISLSVLM